MEMSICERFPAMTPLTIRREKARDFFTLIVRYSNYSDKQQKKAEQPSKPKIIRRPASDTWF